MKICFATNNANKIQEVQALLGAQFEIVSLKDIGCFEELPETQATLEGNSLQKARHVYDHYHVPCFADDTGLEVRALNGAPGVKSARYAGDQRSNTANIELLLNKLEAKQDREAQFRTVITYIASDNEVKQFEGIAEGVILKELCGLQGFGYDPVFKPKGYDQSFAEMSMAEKNAISHRALAVNKLATYLKSLK